MASQISPVHGTVYGIGDPTDIDAITTRIEEATGISAANLTHIRSANVAGWNWQSSKRRYTRFVHVCNHRS